LCVEQEERNPAEVIPVQMRDPICCCRIAISDDAPQSTKKRSLDVRSAMQV
jgi:hypothetical protein